MSAGICMQRRMETENWRRPFAVNIRPTGGAGRDRNCDTKGIANEPFQFGRLNEEKKTKKH